MQKGTKVIFNQDYIDEITRHRDIAKRKYEVENLPKEKQEAKQVYDYWERKLEFAENFQDTIMELKHTDLPNLTVVKTMNGGEYALKSLQVI